MKCPKCDREMETGRGYYLDFADDDLEEQMKSQGELDTHICKICNFVIMEA